MEHPIEENACRARAGSGRKILTCSVDLCISAAACDLLTLTIQGNLRLKAGNRWTAYKKSDREPGLELVQGGGYGSYDFDSSA